jgi:hypothetical protein
MITMTITAFCDIMKSILKTFVMIYQIIWRLVLENSSLHNLSEIYGMSIKSLYNIKNLLQRLESLWGYVKDIVHRTKVRDITNLKQRITDALATTDESILQRTCQKIAYRLDVLRATNGAHIEVY